MDSDTLLKHCQNNQLNRLFSETQTNRKRVIQVLDLFNSKYKCKICRKRLRYKADEITHRCKHRLKSSSIFCPICKKIFKSYQYLTLHLMVDHLKEKPYGCRLCKRRFHAFISLKRHCYKFHLNKMNNSLSSRSSSSNSSNSPLSFDSSELNLLDLIDYDNSQIVLSDCNDSLNKFKLGGTIWNDCLNKDVDNLDLINISPLTMIDQITESSISMNESEDIDPLFDTKQNDTNEEIFTIITQFNICECKICLKLFKTNSDYLNHYWNAHMDQFKHGSDQCKNNENFECWSCFLKLKTLTNENKKRTNFKNQSELVKHLQLEHLNEMPFRCSICTDLHFNDLDTVKSHLLKHLSKDVDEGKNVFMFACLSCEQIYSDYDTILDHFIHSSTTCNLNAQLSPNHSYTCDDCGDIYSNEKAFRIHLDQHKFLQKSEQTGVLIRKTPIFINNKINSNTPIKNVNLSINNKKYSIDALVNSAPKNSNSKLVTSSASNLINELKPQKSGYFSNISNSAFVIPRKKDETRVKEQPNANVNSKLSTFSSVKPISNLIQSEKPKLKCDNCGYFFENIFDLNLHKQLHNSLNIKRPYKCHLCQVTFSKADQLFRHMIVHQASEQDSVCQICFSSFSRKQDLDRHMLFHSK